MLGEVSVLLVGDVPVGGDALAGDDRFAVDAVADVAAASGNLAPDVVVVASRALEAAVDRLSAPVVAVTDDPAAALAAGATEWVPADAAGAVLAHRIAALAERERRRRRERTLLDDPMAAVVVLDEAGRVRRVNDAALSFAGLDREAVLGEPLWELPWTAMSSLEPAAFRALVERAAAGERVRERVQARDAQDVVRQIDVVARPMDGGGGVVVEGRDVGMLLDEGASVSPPSRRLRTIVENLPIVLFALDDAGTFTLSEGRGLGRLGLDPGEVVGESVFDVYADSPAIVEAVERALDGEPVSNVVEVGDVAFEAWYRPVFDGGGGDDGAVQGVLGAAIDVTDKVARERELERYRTLVETVGDPMYVLDDAGHIEMVNDAMATHLGYDRERLVGEHVSLVLEEADVAEGEALIGDILRDDDRRWGTYELTVIDADGERTPYENNVGVITDDDGRLVGSVGVVRDVSDRLARERDLEQYETIVETVPDGVFVLDQDGVIRGGNETAARMFGHEKADLLGEPFVSLVDAGTVDASIVERYTDVVRELLSSESDRERGRLEFEIHPPGAPRRVVEIHVALRPYDEAYRGTIGVARDVTAHRDRERQLERQNERLEEFAGVVSHDLRNPLTVARGAADLLADHVGDDGAAELDRLDRSLRRMDELIENLLELARKGQMVTEPVAVELATLAGEAWRPVPSDDAGLVVDTDATVEADRERLRQLLENLFRNAVEHGSTSPRSQAREDAVEHGSASPRSQAREDAGEHAVAGVRVEVGDLPDGRGFYVADDGSGVPDDERDSVFEYGYSTDDEGTGFGLAIVRSIAEAHGWQVDLGESDDGGARFEFTGVVRAE